MKPSSGVLLSSLQHPSHEKNLNWASDGLGSQQTLGPAASSEIHQVHQVLQEEHLEGETSKPSSSAWL